MHQHSADQNLVLQEPQPSGDPTLLALMGGNASSRLSSTSSGLR